MWSKIKKLYFLLLSQCAIYTGKKRVLVLTLHRTTVGSVWESLYNNSPEDLMEMFTLMKQRGFHFITLEEALGNKPLKHPTVTIVLDDGFADNLYECVPIFQKLNIPYCIFLPAAVILRKEITLEAMAEYMLNHPNWKSSKIKKVDTIKEDKMAMETVINFARNAKTLQDMDGEKELFMKDNNTTLMDEMNHLYLSKEQVQVMKEDPLCTFGAHSYRHVPMKRLTQEELNYNTKEAKNLLEKIIGKPILYFAYPFGGFLDNYTREFNAVKSAGFTNGFMFCSGVMTENFCNYPYMIPRIQISPVKTPIENIKKYEKLLKITHNQEEKYD